MGKAIDLRGDYDAGALFRLARSIRDAVQTRRLLALASIYDGGSRGRAAEIGDGTIRGGPGNSDHWTKWIATKKERSRHGQENEIFG